MHPQVMAVQGHWVQNVPLVLADQTNSWYAAVGCDLNTRGTQELGLDRWFFEHVMIRNQNLASANSSKELENLL